MSIMWIPMPPMPPSGLSSRSARHMPSFQAAAAGPLIWPSAWSTVPSAPAASSRCISAVAGRKRRLWPSAMTTPAAWQAATAASALAFTG